MRIVRIMLVAGIVALLGASAVWASGAATLKVEKTKIGKVVADSRGHTLYMFRADHGGKSACYGACATYWPPLTTAGKPKAGAGIEAALLGTIKRKDGKLQVTYKKRPLYLYVGDSKPGQTTGEGSNGFGAKWYAVTPKGAVIDND